MDHPCYSLILHPVISISLDPFRSIWQVNTLQQRPTQSNLSPSGYRHLTPICLWQDASLATVEQTVVRHWFLRGYLITTICYPCAMYTRKSEQTSWHQSVYYLVFWNSLSYLDILQSPLYKIYMCEDCQKCWTKLLKGMQHLSFTTESWKDDLLSYGMY